MDRRETYGIARDSIEDSGKLILIYLAGLPDCESKGEIVW